MKKAVHIDFEWSKIIKLWIMLLSCGCILLILVQLLPQERVKNNVRKSYEMMNEEGVYPTLGIPQTAYSLDNWTDASLLEFLFHADSSRPIYSAFIAEEVDGTPKKDLNGVEKLGYAVQDESLDVIQRPAYWNGFIIFLRPLLTVFDYYVARGLLHKLTMILMGLFVIWNAKRVGIFEAIGTAVIFPLFTVNVLSMEFAMGIFCLVIAMGTAVYMYECDNVNYLTSMFIVGIIVAYMDWLSIPLITFGIPAIYAISKMYKTSKSIIKFGDYFNVVFNSAVGWCMGYGIMVLSKTIIATILMGPDALGYLVGRIADDGITNMGSGVNWLLYAQCTVALVRCIFPEILELDCLRGYIGGGVVFVLFVFVVCMVMIYYKYLVQKHDYIKIMLLIAFAPMAWYIVFSGHINHIGIEFRTLMITCYAVLFIFKSSKEGLVDINVH